MSLRDSLKQSIGSTQEKCCTVAPPSGCNTQQITQILQPCLQQVMQQHPQEASSIKVIDATRDATTTQQTSKKHATTVQQALKQHATKDIEIELVRAFLYRINEPEEDHHLVLDKCRRDPDAMRFFLKFSRGESFDE